MNGQPISWCRAEKLSALRKFSVLIPLLVLAACDGNAIIEASSEESLSVGTANNANAVGSCAGSADPSTINASWMAGKWGVSISISGGHETYERSEVEGFDVDAAVEVISSLPGVGWVNVNLTNGAHSDRAIAPVPVLDDINPLAAPERDLFGEIATALQAKDIKVIAYIASQGPAMLKHGAASSLDFDDTITGLNANGRSTACISMPTVDDDEFTTYCSANMNRWRDKVYSLYPSTNQTLYRKYEKAMAEHIVEEFSTRYGSLIDGWWFDHTIVGDAALLAKAALAGNKNAVLAFNEGEKVPLTNTVPGLADYTFGHPNPLAFTVPQDDANDPMVASIENATDGILYGPDCEPSLGHIFMPIQENWNNSSEIVFSEHKATEWQNRVLGSGGSITWALAHQGTTGDLDDPLVLADQQVEFIKRIQSNTGSVRHYPLDSTVDAGITQSSINFPFDAARNETVARFSEATDIITLDDYYGIEGEKARTVSGWFRTSEDGGTLVDWGVANPGERWWLKIINGKIKLIMHDANVVGSTTVNDNIWHHFAVVSPHSLNSKIRIYIDGQRETETSLGTNFNTQVRREVQVGGNFIGFIDELRFYERTISRAEVNYLATAESSVDLELALNLKFDEASWRNWSDGTVDSSIYKREASYSNKSIPGNTDPVRGTVAVFNQAASDLIVINSSGDDVSSSGYNGVPGVEPRSVSAWIKTNDANGVVVQWGSIAENDGENWIVRTFDGKLRLSIKGGNVDGSISIDDGNWHHIAVVAPDNDLMNTRLYIDGTADSSTVSGSPTKFDTTTVNNEATDVIIGIRYSGSIDDLSIYQRALSPAEIRTMSNN